MAELVDALVSGTSEVTLVEVQVLSRAPKRKGQATSGLFILVCWKRLEPAGRKQPVAV